jgi:type 1 glutamine amidotransferase
MTRPKCVIRLALFLALFPSLTRVLAAATAPAKHIVLIAGAKSHGPGEHEYLKSIKLLKALLDRAPNLKSVQTEMYFNGWPDDPSVLDRADSIVVLSDGDDGSDAFHGPFMTTERMSILEIQMKRGCGFMTFHFSTFTPAKYATQILDWNGAYFDWQGGHGEGGFFGADNEGRQQWHSLLRVMEAGAKLGTPNHPISRGVSSFQLKDEFYYQLRFRENEARLKPILRVPALSSTPENQVVAWAVERKDGGRGFGTTTGHYFNNWRNDNYRKLILNAIVWTAGVAVPEGGVISSYINEEEVNQALMERPIPTLLVTGDSSATRDGEKAASAIVAALNSETPRFVVSIADDSEILAKHLSQYKLIVLTNCGALPASLRGKARENLTRYLRSGGALTIIYSSDGPDRGTEPDFEGICKHLICKPIQDTPNVVFHVKIVDRDHPATKGISDYQLRAAETTDSLDFDLPDAGEIHVVATVQSRGTGQATPMAFTSSYAKGRIYHLIAGRDPNAFENPKLIQLIRYGSLWAAGQ